MASIKSDARKLRKNAGATADELREFLAEMRGKSPREMLGAVASSKLGKSLVQATAGVAAFIALFTIVPFIWGAIFDKDEPVSPPVAEAPATPDPGSGGTPATTPKEPSLDPDADPDKSLDALGIGGSKEASLDSNPLEDSADDLLKDLE